MKRLDSPALEGRSMEELDVVLAGRTSVSQDAGDDRHEASARDGEDAAPMVELVSVPTLLGDFWGPDWPQLEAHLRSGPNRSILDMELRPDQLPPPWEEVQASLAEILAAAIEEQRDRIPWRFDSRIGMPWADPLTIESLVERIGDRLDEPELVDSAALSRVEIRAGSRLRDVRAGHRDLVDAYHAVCLQLVQTGRYNKSLYFYDSAVSEVLKADTKRPHVPLTLLYEGYWVKFLVYSDEHPELENMASALARTTSYCEAVVVNAVQQQ